MRTLAIQFCQIAGPSQYCEVVTNSVTGVNTSGLVVLQKNNLAYIGIIEMEYAHMN